jgi:OFA family oxalate/formate antiporter-like MFS transporter
MNQSVGQAGGKRGIVVLVTGAILQLFFGIIYVWSVFVLPVSEHFAWSAEDVKLTSSFMLCCFVLGILLGGKLQAKIGTAKVVFIGGLTMAAGMLLTSFLPLSAPWLIYVCYGILGGLGVGMAYNAIITCAQRWFPHKRGLATGVSVCTFGFSTVVFAPLVEALVGAVGLNNTFRILAAAFFVATVALFRFSALPQVDATRTAAASSGGGRQVTTSEALRTKEFYYIALSLMLGIAAYFILNPSFKTMAVERGLDAAVGTAIVMVTGVANALGRLAIPVLSDKIGREGGALVILLLTAVCAVALAFAQGFLFMAAVAVIAFCYGGYSGVYPLIVGDTFGMDNVGSNYGMVMLGFAASALFMPMIIGAISSDMARFIVLAALAAVGFVMVILLKQANKTRGQKAG